MPPTVIRGDFEWEDAKAKANLEKHGVSFEEAATALADPGVVLFDDDSGPGVMKAVGNSRRRATFDRGARSAERSGAHHQRLEGHARGTTTLHGARRLEG